MRAEELWTQDLPAPEQTREVPSSLAELAAEYHRRDWCAGIPWPLPVLMRPREVEELVARAADRAAPGGHVCEVGAGMGGSTMALSVGNEARGRVGEWVVSVDAMWGPENEWRAARVQRLCKRSVRTVFAVAESEFLSVFGGGRPTWRLALIDGDHTEEAARRDLEAVAPRMVPGGCILVHDVWRGEDGGPGAAFEWASWRVFGGVRLVPEPELVCTLGVFRAEAVVAPGEQVAWPRNAEGRVEYRGT